jgi:hypothetical protein
MINTLFLTLFLLCSNVFAGGAKTVWVNAYTKSNGTYVSGHYRSPPTGTSAGVSSYAGSYSSSSYATTSARNNEYCYDVKIWIDGNLIDQHGKVSNSDIVTSGKCDRLSIYRDDGTPAEASEDIAAESGIVRASVAVQHYYFSKGLSAASVFDKTNSIFTQENCFAMTSSEPEPGSEDERLYRVIEQCAISNVSNK